MLDGSRQIEGAVERGIVNHVFAELLAQRLLEGASLFPGSHRRPLHDPVGVVATKAGFN